MKRSVLPAVLALVLALVLAGCSDSDEPEGDGSKPGGSPSGTSDGESATGAENLEFPKGTRLPHATKKARKQGWKTVPYQRPFEPCYPDPLSLKSDAQRTASHTATDSGPTMAQVEQVELYTSAKAAGSALEELRDAVAECDGKEVQQGFARKWAVAKTSQTLADADESFLVFGWYVSADGDPGPPGGPVVTVVRVGNAVYTLAADGTTSFVEESNRLDAALVYEEEAAAYLPELSKLGA